MKKILCLVMVLAASLGVLAGCAGAKTSSAISVISREDGSGTRGAFIELFKIQEKDASGTKVDKTIDSATITNSTSVMLTSIAQNEDAIGYISLGSLNDTVKALAIDGVKATTDNVKNSTYKISRPFNIATLGTVSPAAQDFINYILSSDGQAVVEKNGYIALTGTAPYSSANVSGKVTVAGSSSVTPVMEKLKEAYVALNPNVTVEIQQSDSTTGMTSTIDKVCDIGMASRELTDSETAKGLKSTMIATDGIAVIVNLNNKLDGLTSQQVKDIYTGVTANWSDIK